MFNFGFRFGRMGGSSLPTENLILRCSGQLISGADVTQDPNQSQDPDLSFGEYRRDTVSGFHFKILPNGDTISGDWNTTNATYHADEPILYIDFAPLVAADAIDGPFFFDAGGAYVERTQAEIEAYCGRTAPKTAVSFGCKGLIMYSVALTGQDLLDLREYQCFNDTPASGFDDGFDDGF